MNVEYGTYTIHESDCYERRDLWSEKSTTLALSLNVPFSSFYFLHFYHKRLKRSRKEISSILWKARRQCVLYLDQVSLNSSLNQTLKMAPQDGS